MGRWCAKWAVKLFLRFLGARLVHADVASARRWAARVDWLLGRPAADATTSRVELGTCDGIWIDVPGTGRDRVILYLHGGAFIMETPGIHAKLLAELCRGSGARGLMVAYRLAPEHPFPAAVHDCLGAYRRLLDAGCAPSRIAIAGDSAGGNLVLVTLLAARDAGLPQPCCAIALSPVTDATFSGDSLRRNERHDPLFTRAAMDRLAPLYAPDGDPTQPWLSPLFARLDGLPPILLMVGSAEMLLDDSVRFATRARDVTLEVWHDMPHAFPVFALLPESGEAIARMCAFLDARFASTR